MMRPLRIEQDPVHGKSRQRLDETGLLKKDCERTRKALPDYLRGYVFWSTRNRIERHLERCVVCKSEFDALRCVEDTCQLLKHIDVDAHEGVAHRVKEGISTLTKLKKILYRPLWLVGIALAVAGTYYYAGQPRQLDIEIENIVRTAPSTTSSVQPEVLQPKAHAATPPVASVRKPVQQPVSTPAVAPFAVSITPVNETEAILQINVVMRGHEQLRKLKFSKADRVLYGNLTAQELLGFFDRIAGVAKAGYDRKRLESFPTAQPIPFVLTLKAAPRDVEQPVPEPKPQPGTGSEPHASAETTASAPSAPAPAPPAAH